MKMFSKEWKALSEYDRAFINSIRGSNAAAKLKHALNCAEEASALYLVRNMKMPGLSTAEELYSRALRKNMVPVVRFMMHAWLQDFSSTHGDTLHLHQTFELAARTRDMAFWRELLQINSKAESWYTVDGQQLVTIAARAGWVQPFRDDMESGRLSADNYSRLLEATVQRPLEQLQQALLSARHYEADTLNRALYMATRLNHPEKVAALFAAGARPDAHNGEIFWCAVENDRADIVQDFLAQGFDVSNLSLDTRLNITPERLIAARRRAILDSEKYSLLGDHTLVDREALPQFGNLTMMFNFATRQQIIVVEKEGAAIPPAVVRFDDIGNPEALEAVAARFVALGGNAAYLEAPKKKTPLIVKPAT